MPQSITPTSTIVMFDGAGLPTADPDEARSGQITEYDADGVVTMRTYWGHNLDTPDDETAPIFSQGGTDDDLVNPVNADGPKKTWDVRTPDQQLVTSLSGLAIALGWWQFSDAEQRSKLANMTTLPAWNSAPAQLKREAEEWLSSG